MPISAICNQDVTIAKRDDVAKRLLEKRVRTIRGKVKTRQPMPVDELGNFWTRDISQIEVLGITVFDMKKEHSHAGYSETGWTKYWP